MTAGVTNRFGLTLDFLRRLVADIGADPSVRSPGMVYGGVAVSGGRLFVATCTLEGPLARRPTCVACIGGK